MVVAAQAPADIGAEVSAQEPAGAEAAPLVDVLLLVTQQVLVCGGRCADRHDRANGDGVGTGRDRTADPEPMVAVPPEAHSSVELGGEGPAVVSRSRVVGAEDLEEIDELLAGGLIVLDPVEEAVELALDLAVGAGG